MLVKARATLTHLLRVEPVAGVDAGRLCARSAREGSGGVVGVSNGQARAAQRAAGGHRATIGELLSHGVSPKIVVLVRHKTGGPQNSTDQFVNRAILDKLALNLFLVDTKL